MTVPLKRLGGAGLAALLSLTGSCMIGGLAPAGAAPAHRGQSSAATARTTAWQPTGGGHFRIDTPNVVRSSDIVLDAVPAQGKQSMPIGNGAFGAAVWAAHGFTAQLNRDDTMPGRKSPGQLVIPGLAAMTSASDYHASLDLYDATYRQSGGGMTATTYIRADKDEMVVDVTGADPSAVQTAAVDLQSGRNPTTQTAMDGRAGVLSETWVDDQSASGGTGKTFGSLAAVTASGQDVSASTPDSRTAQVSFRADVNGHFRVVVAVPHWAGGDASAAAARDLGRDATAPAASLAHAHLAWWHRFWARSNLVKLSSDDQVADFIGNIRTIYLYIEAASERGAYPSTQAGVNDLFNFTRDSQQWGGDHFWFWNLRMDLAANISSGLSNFNTPFFQMYRRDLPSTEQWTRDQFPDTRGICLPETMRFDGTGWYLGTGTGNASCDSSETSYNAKTLSSGAELGSWIWRQYQQTDDRAFLRAYYPLMQQAAKFLLTYAKVGADGKLHTSPSNAHETQWDVHDPITDISAMKMLFPMVIDAARTLHTDSGLVRRLQRAIPEILDFPRTDAATRTQLKSPADDGDGNTVFAYSYVPAAPYHNNENLDLEPVWPYGLVGDTSPLYDVAKLSYTTRKFHNSNTWTYDPVQAARLDLRDEVASTLRTDAATHVQYANGLAAFSSSMTEPYDESAGVMALTVNESLATDYDGQLRIAPAMPSTWNAQGTVSIAHRSKVDVQTEDGQIVTAVVESGSKHDMVIRNPWPGQAFEIARANPSGRPVVGPTRADSVVLHADPHSNYSIQRPVSPLNRVRFAPVTAAPATAPRQLPGSSSVIGINAGTSTTPCASPTHQVLLSWDPTSGATINDASSYHRDGAFVNESPSYATDGPTGSAAVIGTGGYLSGGTTTLGYLTAATFATEIKVTGGTGYRRIWDWKTGSGGDDDGFILDLTPGGQLRIITSGENHTLSTTLPTGVWEDLVVTVADDGTVNVYLDGQRVDGTTLSETAINGCAAGGLHIGADQSGGQAINAEVDRSAVFSTALTADQLANWQSLSAAG